MIKVEKINSGENTNISIFQYIRNNNISIQTTISNIQSGHNTDIVIEIFFNNSPDYKKILLKIEEKKKEITKKNSNKDQHIFLNKELNELLNIERKFKIDALNLASLILKIKPRTEKLKNVNKLFELGLFSEAEKLLDKNELLNNLDELKALMEYYEKKDLYLSKILNELNILDNG